MSGFRVGTNVSAMTAASNLGVINDQQRKSIEKLSSGLRINRAADDAAGLAISERLKTQINGINQAIYNVQDGMALLQVAEGGIETVSDMLQRIRTLAVQASNDTLTDDDRALIQTEVDQLLAEVDRQASTVAFNSKVLLTGTYDGIGAPTGPPVTQTFDSNGVTAAMARPNYYENPLLASPGTVAPEPIAGGSAEIADPEYVSASSVGAGNALYSTNIAGNRETMRFQFQPSVTASEITNLQFRFVGGSEVDGAADTLNLQLYDFQNGSWVTLGANTGTLLAFQDTTFSATGDLSRFVDSDGDIWAQVFTQTATTGGVNDSSVRIDYTSLTVTTQARTSDDGLFIQAGANEGETIEAFLPDARRAALGLNGLSVATRTSAEAAIDTVDTALDTVNGSRAEIGALQNRLEKASAFNGIFKENMSAANSRIKDLDFSSEIVEFTKMQVLQQSGTAALSQANVSPQAILQLLQ